MRMAFENSISDASAFPSLEDGVQKSKRSEARQRVLLRAQVHAVNQQAEVHIGDLSRGGFRGSTDIALDAGQMVFISLDDITHCLGTVRWTQDRRFGVKFCQPLDMLPSGSQTDLGKVPGHQARMSRITTHLKAKISLFNNSYSAKIRNISKSGMMVETDVPLTPSEQLFIKLSDGKILAADVRWVEGDRVGVQLAGSASLLQFTYGDLQ